MPFAPQSPPLEADTAKGDHVLVIGWSINEAGLGTAHRGLDVPVRPMVLPVVVLLGEPAGAPWVETDLLEYAVPASTRTPRVNVRN